MYILSDCRDSSEKWQKHEFPQMNTYLTPIESHPRTLRATNLTNLAEGTALPFQEDVFCRHYGEAKIKLMLDLET
jgi:hypothetical protein